MQKQEQNINFRYFSSKIQISKVNNILLSYKASAGVGGKKLSLNKQFRVYLPAEEI